MYIPHHCFHPFLPFLPSRFCTAGCHALSCLRLWVVRTFSEIFLAAFHARHIVCNKGNCQRRCTIALKRRAEHLHTKFRQDTMRRWSFWCSECGLESPTSCPRTENLGGFPSAGAQGRREATTRVVVPPYLAGVQLHAVRREAATEADTVTTSRRR